jgi:hypothetical protein
MNDNDVSECDRHDCLATESLRLDHQEGEGLTNGAWFGGGDRLLLPGEVGNGRHSCDGRRPLPVEFCHNSVILHVPGGQRKVASAADTTPYRRAKRRPPARMLHYQPSRAAIRMKA